WAGRLPMALSGLALLGAIGLWVKRFAGARAGLYAALALGTTPLFLLHSREMVGATPSFLAAALVAIGASNAIFPGARGADGSSAAPWLWLLVAAVASVLGCLMQGALLFVLPSLGAVALTALLAGVPWDEGYPRARRVGAWIVVGSALLVGVLVA